MKPGENYVKVYEITFENTKEFKKADLISNFYEAQKEGTTVATNKGVFYIKEIKKDSYSHTLLFGKDNEDASNYKRDRKKLEFEKIDIDEDVEVLTDFVHISISNEKRSSKNETYTIFIEKSSLIQIRAFEEFIDHIAESALVTTIRRRVVKDFFEQIKNAKRIIKITQTKKDKPLPLVKRKRKKYDENEISVDEIVEIKPTRRGASIPLPFFNDMFDRFDKSDDQSKMVVDIKDSHGNVFPIDFDKLDAQYTIKYSIPLNIKTDKIQEDIAEKMNWTMHLDNEDQI